MFDRTQYVIEMTLGGRLVPFSRDTYSVMDTHGNLLGYAKKQRLKLWPRFWFEGTDETRMGEFRLSKNGCEVYDAQDQLQATITQKTLAPSKKKKSLLGIILFIGGLLMTMFGVIAYVVTTPPTTSLVIVAFIGGALTVLGVYYLFSMYERPVWYVEDPGGAQLAEIKQGGKFIAEYHVLTPDGSTIAHVHKKRGLAAVFRYSYNIDITRQDFNPLLILSFAIQMADRNKQMASTPPRVG